MFTWASDIEEFLGTLKNDIIALVDLLPDYVKAMLTLVIGVFITIAVFKAIKSLPFL